MAMYAMRYLKEHDIKLKNNVMLVFGMNEEIRHERYSRISGPGKMPEIFPGS